MKDPKNQTYCMSITLKIWKCFFYTLSTLIISEEKNGRKSMRSTTPVVLLIAFSNNNHATQHYMCISISKKSMHQKVKYYLPFLIYTRDVMPLLPLLYKQYEFILTMIYTIISIISRVSIRHHITCLIERKLKRNLIPDASKTII